MLRGENFRPPCSAQALLHFRALRDEYFRCLRIAIIERSLTIQKMIRRLSLSAHENMPSREMAAQVLDAPRRLADPPIGSLASGDRLGGVMRIGRTIFIPVILALGTAGTTLAVSAAPAMAWHAPTVHAHVIALSSGHASHYHC